MIAWTIAFALAASDNPLPAGACSGPSPAAVPFDLVQTIEQARDLASVYDAMISAPPVGKQFIAAPRHHVEPPRLEITRAGAEWRIKVLRLGVVHPPIWVASEEMIICAQDGRLAGLK